MPGITFCLTASDESEALRRKVSQAQEEMLHSPEYRSQVRLGGPGCAVGYVGYPEYPFSFGNTGPHLVAIEGRVYAKSQSALDQELVALAQEAFAAPATAERLISHWILENDGEYVVLMVSDDGERAIAFTDPLGRLPIYYRATSTCLLLARECKFILHLQPQIAFDRIGCAQLLWIGYPLGRKTLYEGVNRAPGAMLLSARRDAGRVRTEVSSLFELNLDHKDARYESPDRALSELLDRFSWACSTRGFAPGVDQNVIALSGGQDSRAVAAGLRKAGASCVAATYLGATPRSARDAPIAAQIARALEIPWELIRLPGATPEDEERLVRMKEGLNHVGMAYILGFLEQIIHRWGRGAIYFSGDGGDKVFPDLRPGRPLRSMEDLVGELLRRHGTLPAERLETLMDLKPGTLLQELRDVLDHYPEADLQQKAVHFTIYERGRKWLYEGEDRTRFFLWETSPFYSLPFFQLAMRIPDRLKRHNQLYQQFQKRLSPVCAGIVDADSGLPAGSPLYRWKLRYHAAAMRLPRGVRRKIQHLVSGGQRHRFPVPERAGAYLASGRKGEHPFSALMSPDVVSALLEAHGQRAFHNWWTLMLVEKSFGTQRASVAQGPERLLPHARVR